MNGVLECGVITQLETIQSSLSGFVDGGNYEYYAAYEEINGCFGCSGGCQGSCEGNCEGCRGSCEGSCDGTCSAYMR